MQKGRKVPEQTTDHAANFRDRIGRASYEAAPLHSTPWSSLTEDVRELHRTMAMAVFEAITIQRRGIRGTFEIGSGYAHGRKEPYVEIAVNLSPAQFSPAKARELGLLLLECADAAETDSVIWRYATDELGLDQVQTARLLRQFREYREKQRGTPADAA